MRTGRPHTLPESTEWELFCMRVGGARIRTCATAFGVSVPTANRIIAKFRARYGDEAGQLARDFRFRLERLRDSA